MDFVCVRCKTIVAYGRITQSTPHFNGVDCFFVYEIGGARPNTHRVHRRFMMQFDRVLPFMEVLL